jgi:hypothetical protein
MHKTDTGQRTIAVLYARISTKEQEFVFTSGYEYILPRNKGHFP